MTTDDAGGGDGVEARDAGTGEEIVDGAVGHRGVWQREPFGFPVGGDVGGTLGTRDAQQLRAAVPFLLQTAQIYLTVRTRGAEEHHVGLASEEIARRHERCSVAERHLECRNSIAHARNADILRVVALRDARRRKETYCRD